MKQARIIINCALSIVNCQFVHVTLILNNNKM